MHALQQLIDKGGPTIIAIMGLSVLLYWRCFALLLTLRRLKRRVAGGGTLPEAPATWAPVSPDASAASRQRREEEIRAAFRHPRLAIGAMIAAAPLLGLLGTVSGMTKTFDTLSRQAGEKSMEGLARGISEVLVATESGLLVALPALALLYLAQREMNACMAAAAGLPPPAKGGEP